MNTITYKVKGNKGEAVVFPKKFQKIIKNYYEPGEHIKVRTITSNWRLEATSECSEERIRELMMIALEENTKRAPGKQLKLEEIVQGKIKETEEYKTADEDALRALREQSQRYKEEFKEAQATFEREYDELIGDIERLEQQLAEKDRILATARSEPKASTIDEYVLSIYDSLIVTRSTFEMLYEGRPLKEYADAKTSEEDKKRQTDALAALQLPPEFVNHDQARQALEQYEQKLAQTLKGNAEYCAMRRKEQDILDELDSSPIKMIVRQKESTYTLELPIAQKEHYRTLESDLIRIADEKLTKCEGYTYNAPNRDALRTLRKEYKEVLGVNVSIKIIKEEEL